MYEIFQIKTNIGVLLLSLRMYRVHAYYPIHFCLQLINFNGFPTFYLEKKSLNVYSLFCISSYLILKAYSYISSTVRMKLTNHL